MKTPWLIDETLRDGIQPLGKTISAAQRKHLIKLLSQAGIPEAFIGIPAQGEKEICIIREVISQSPQNIRLTVWCRAKESDIQAAIKTHAHSIHISFPASLLLQEICHTTPIQTQVNISQLITYAKKHFSYVSIGFQDASRAPLDELKQYTQLAVAAGATRIRLADTVGCLTPERTYLLINSLAPIAEAIPLELHAHNDFGLATINSISALQAGATAISVTINGIGERAGNASLEEVAIALEQGYQQKTNLDLTMLVALSAYVQKITHWTIARTKAVVGPNIYQHASGIHCHGLLHNTLSYQPFNPELVGHKGTRIVLHDHSGKTAQEVIRKNYFLPLNQFLFKFISRLPFIPHPGVYIHEQKHLS